MTTVVGAVVETRTTQTIVVATVVVKVPIVTKVRITIAKVIVNSCYVAWGCNEAKCERSIGCVRGTVEGVVWDDLSRLKSATFSCCLVLDLG